MNMEPSEYANILERDNTAIMEHYVRRKHPKFYALFGAILDCDSKIEDHKKQIEEHIFYNKVMVILVNRFNKYCILNKDTLIKQNLK